MPVLWKSVAVAAGLVAAVIGIEKPATVTAPAPQVTVAATRTIEASPIFAALKEIDGVNTWRAVLTRSGYAPTSAAPVTIMVPSDAAFVTGDDRFLISLLGASDSGKLGNVVRQTIINHPLDPARFAGRKISTVTLAGNAITLDATDQSLMAGDAEILAVKHASDGSVIFIVDHLPMNSEPGDTTDDWGHHE